MPFKKGQSGNPKGAPKGGHPGAGRPTDWIKAEIQKIGDPLKIIQFYYDVANGKDLEQVVTDSGVSIAVPAPVKDRLRAGELYLDRRIGKVPQPTEITGADGGPLETYDTSALIALQQELERQKLERQNARNSQLGAGKEKSS